MPIETLSHPAADLTINQWQGEVTFALLKAAVATLAEASLTRRTLWDFSAATNVTITSEEIRLLIQVTAAGGGRRPDGAQTAIIAPQDFFFGLGRQAQTFADMEGIKPKVGVFRDRREALQWLGVANLPEIV